MRIKLTFVQIVFLFFSIIKAQTPQQLPGNVGRSYVKYDDGSISDEFNQNTLDLTKWGRRNTGGYMVENFHNDSSLVVMESENGINYVSIKATSKNGPIRTAGIVTRASGFYGFYVVRFRFRGFGTDSVLRFKSIWHPSVWAAIHDHIDGVNRSTIKGKRPWLEIDFMEWETNNNGWSCDAPARFIDSNGKLRKVITKGPNLEKAIVKGPVKVIDGEWITIGLEYTPEYLRLWKWSDEKWTNISDREVRFVENNKEFPEKSYTISTIGKEARSPVFWVLGNVVSRYLYDQIENGTCNKSKEDLAMDIDFFRYYRHKLAVKLDWPWENQLPNGGGKIQKY